jgi:hypothetical protein
MKALYFSDRYDILSLSKGKKGVKNVEKKRNLFFEEG